MMHEAERYWFPLRQRINRDTLSVNGHIGSSEVLEGCYDTDTAGVNHTTVIIKDVYISANRPTFSASDNAEGFGVYGIGPSDCLF